MYSKKSFISTILLVLIINLSFSPSLQAETLMEKAKRAKAQMASLRKDLGGVTEKYNVNYMKLEEIHENIYANKAKLNKAKADLGKYQKILNKRVGTLYRYDDTTMLDVILSSKSWEELVISWDFVNMIGEKDGFVTRRVKKLKRDISDAQEELMIAEKNQNQVVDEIGGQKKELEAGLAKQKSLMAGLEAQIEKLNRIPKPVPVASNTSYSGNISASGWVFPVASPYSFSDTWGASRGGGTRSHKGTDIMTNYGTSCYAVVSGTVSNTSGGSAGLWQILRGDDGNVYYYMHQSGFAASGRVSQGQVIGYAGNSGNASGGASHVHFEFHPGGGAAVNPYPYLVAAQG